MYYCVHSALIFPLFFIYLYAFVVLAHAVFGMFPIYFAIFKRKVISKHGGIPEN